MLEQHPDTHESVVQTLSSSQSESMLHSDPLCKIFWFSAEIVTLLWRPAAAMFRLFPLRALHLLLLGSLHRTFESKPEVRHDM